MSLPSWSVLFLIATMISGIFSIGFSGTFSEIYKILFIVFLFLTILSAFRDT
jgi:uncharacterized membrane protein YtjA (UPF0391 family)